MNVHLFRNPNNKWIKSTFNSLFYSLQDLGYRHSSEDKADLVIMLRHIPPHYKKVKGKKYIFFQTEQNLTGSKQFPNRSDELRKIYQEFNPDKVWGYDIDIEEEEYVPVGYHPCLEKTICCERKYDVTLLGTKTARRLDFLNKVKNKFQLVSGIFRDKDKIKFYKSSSININYHSYEATNFTEWDRISVLLANKCFFISEEMYCPLKGIIYFNDDTYDSVISTYNMNAKLRNDMAHVLYDTYKTEFDMRNILRDKLLHI